MTNFNETVLVQTLALFSPRVRVAFAASAAHRLLENFQIYSRHYQFTPVTHPEKILERLWDQLHSAQIDDQYWSETLDQVMASFPDESEKWSIWRPLADDALASLAYASECLRNSDAQEAAWAARRAYEAADQAAIRILDIQPGTPDAERTILAHPVVQRELERQERDIDMCKRLNEKAAIEALAKIAGTENLLTSDEARELR